MRAKEFFGKKISGLRCTLFTGCVWCFLFQWVYNILEGRSEADRVVYRDEHPLMGFVLLPDLKWDAKDLSNLYLVAIVLRRDLLSLRDLTDEHIPLLKHIMALGKVCCVCVLYMLVHVRTGLCMIAHVRA